MQPFGVAFFIPSMAVDLWTDALGKFRRARTWVTWGDVTIRFDLVCGPSAATSLPPPPCPFGGGHKGRKKVAAPGEAARIRVGGIGQEAPHIPLTLEDGCANNLRYPPWFWKSRSVG